MSLDVTTMCRTCMKEGTKYYQLLDFMEDNYRIVEMLQHIVPQIDVKAESESSHFSPFICQSCVDKLITGFKFQKLCIYTNDTLHSLLMNQKEMTNLCETAVGETAVTMKSKVEDEEVSDCSRYYTEVDMRFEAEQRPNDYDTDCSVSSEDTAKRRKTFLSNAADNKNCPYSVETEEHTDTRVTTNARKRIEHYAKVTKDTKLLLVQLYEEGRTLSNAAQLASINLNTAKTIIARYKKNGDILVERKRGGKRPKKLTPAILKQIEMFVEKNPKITMKSIREKLLEEENISVSLSTIHYGIQELKSSE